MNSSSAEQPFDLFIEKNAFQLVNKCKTKKKLKRDCCFFEIKERRKYY